MDTATDEPTTAGSSHPRANRFFEWITRLDLPRQPGWIGGVCAGIAARLGIDPLIVRGIAVVVAILGGPALLAYAIAWALLPDAKGTIHLRELIDGRPSGVHAGIGVLLLVSFLPLSQGFWAWGGSFVGLAGLRHVIGGVIWTAVVIALIVAFVVWIARRTAQSGTTTDAAVPPPASPSAPQSTTVAPPVEVGTDFADWRAQQAAVKSETDAFRAAEAASALEVSRRRAEENRLAHERRAAEYAERRRVARLVNPRLRAAHVFLIIGLAIVAGGISALAVSANAAWPASPSTTGFGVATLVVGIGIVVAGIARRRSGFLSFVGIVLVVLLVPIALVPRGSTLVGVSDELGPGTYTQLAGHAWIDVDSTEQGRITLWQGTGTTYIHIDPDAAVTLIATQHEAKVSGYSQDRSGEGPARPLSFRTERRDAQTYVTRARVGAATATALVVDVTQAQGDIQVIRFTEGGAE